MTAKKHNKLIGIFLMAHGTLQAVIMTFVWLIYGGVGAGLMLGGSTLFAATLYAMALGAPHWLGAVTPLGGAAMIAGWCFLACSYDARGDKN